MHTENRIGAVIRSRADISYSRQAQPSEADGQLLFLKSIWHDLSSRRRTILMDELVRVLGDEYDDQPEHSVETVSKPQRLTEANLELDAWASEWEGVSVDMDASRMYGAVACS